MKIARKLISSLTCIAVFLSLTNINAFAMNSNENLVNTQQNVYLEKIEDGYVFTQKADDKSVAIITSNTENVVAISIIYTSNSDIVYQWIINDYPMEGFSQNSLDFWDSIISYAENNLDNASLIEISVDEISENTPMPFSSADADLAEDLVGIVGEEYSNKYTNRLRVMDGHDYRLYESMEFSIRKCATLSWQTGASIASVLAGVVSIAPVPPHVALFTGVLGIVAAVASTILPAGKVNQYSCMALYTRYVTVDNGSTQYGHAYKIRTFDGYEDANPNSTGRAHVFPATEVLFYDPNQSEEYFNNGIFDEAYNSYNNIL